jgi:hypothetical protein
MFAFFDPAHFAQFLVNCLAVAGGFLAGFVVTAGVVWWIDRTFLRGQSPDVLKRAARVLGGAAAALVVALLVFGKGGGGLGGGTGEAVGSGTPATVVGQGTGEAPSPTTPTPPTKPSPPAGERVAVTVLGGADVRDQRFYLLDADTTPRTFDEAKAGILAKKETAGAKGLAVEVRFPPTNALPQDHPAVTRLVAWARDAAGLTVTFPAAGP